VKGALTWSLVNVTSKFVKCASTNVHTFPTPKKYGPSVSNVYWAKISAFVMLEEVVKHVQNGFESNQWARARMRAACWHETSKS
jgi:hypothetical protein